MSKKSLASRILPKALQDDIDRQIEPHLRRRADGDGVCSTKTARERRGHILCTVASLWQMKYCIRKLESLDKRHIDALMARWDAEGKSAEFLHNRVSVLRILADWLGKRHLVGDLSDYFPNERTRRKTATEEDLSYKAKGIDPIKVIEAAQAIDERLAAMIAMQYAFGLRVKESIEIRPANSVVDGGVAIEVFAGTKGGKLSRIPVKDDYQRATLAWVRQVAASGKTGRLRWPDTTWRQAQNRYYYLVRDRLNLSKAQSDFTSHGFRHGFGHKGYEDRTGYPPPVRAPEGHSKPVPSPACPPEKHSKPVPLPPPGLDRDVHKQALLDVSRELGHVREGATAAYVGTYRHGFRRRKGKVTIK